MAGTYDVGTDVYLTGFEPVGEEAIVKLQTSGGGEFHLRVYDQEAINALRDRWVAFLQAEPKKRVYPIMRLGLFF